MPAQSNRGLHGGFLFSVKRLAANPWPLSEQEVAGGLVPPVAQETVLGDVLTDPHQRILERLRRDNGVGEDALRVNLSGVLPLLDIHGAVV